MTLKDEMVRWGNYLFRWRSYLPLLFLPVLMLALKKYRYLGGSETLDDLWDVFCVAIAVSGLSVRALIAGYVPASTSGRNTKRQEAQTLNTSGMYSIVRHPLYLGNFLMWLGVALFTHNWWLVLVAILAFWLYYERIIFAEEEFLSTRFGAEFEEWAGRTRAFVPSFRNWKPPSLPFSWKSVLAREHPTLFAMIVTFVLLDATEDYFASTMPHVDLGWKLLLLAGLVVYTVLRWMKKRHLLSVDGR